VTIELAQEVKTRHDVPYHSTFIR